MELSGCTCLFDVDKEGKMRIYKLEILKTGEFVFPPILDKRGNSFIKWVLLIFKLNIRWLTNYGYET